MNPPNSHVNCGRGRAPLTLPILMAWSQVGSHVLKNWVFSYVPVTGRFPTGIWMESLVPSNKSALHHLHTADISPLLPIGLVEEGLEQHQLVIW